MRMVVCLFGFAEEIRPNSRGRAVARVSAGRASDSIGATDMVALNMPLVKKGHSSPISIPETSSIEPGPSILGSVSVAGAQVDGSLVGCSITGQLSRIVESCSEREGRGESIMGFGSFVREASSATIFEYHFLRQIGRGSNADVYLCRNTSTNELLAAKVYSKIRLERPSLYSGCSLADVEHEIGIMTRYTHPNLLRLVELIEDDVTESLILVMPYAPNGSLLRGESTTEPIPEEWSRFYFQQMAVAVQVMHADNVVHRDIKPENVLLNGTRVMLADFGSAKVLSEGTDIIDETIGTPAFFAPEECKGQAFGAKAADVWKLGVSLYQMLFGRLPFQSEARGILGVIQLSKIIQDQPLRWGSVPVSEQAKLFIARLLAKEARLRPSIDEALRDPWLRRIGYVPPSMGGAGQPSPEADG